MEETGKGRERGGGREETSNLGAGGVLGVVVFIVGEVEHVLLAEEGGLGRRGGVARPVHLVHQELGSLADVLRGKSLFCSNLQQLFQRKENSSQQLFQRV